MGVEFLREFFEVAVFAVVGEKLAAPAEVFEATHD